MEYYEMLLLKFELSLVEKDIDLLERLKPLGVYPDGRIFSTAQFQRDYSQDDFDTLINYWEDFKTSY